MINVNWVWCMLCYLAYFIIEGRGISFILIFKNQTGSVLQHNFADKVHFYRKGYIVSLIMETSGELLDVSEEHEVEWKLLNFSSLSSENGRKYDSPSFSFANESFCLQMYPNGELKNHTGYASLFLNKKSSGLSINIECSLGLKSLNGKKDPTYHFTYIFKKAGNGYGAHRCISRSELFERKADLLPVDVITMFCNLKQPVLSETPNTKCSSCKETLGAEFVSLHERCIERPIKCPDCCDTVLLKKWLQDHKCQEGRLEDNGSFCQDFKNMLLDGINHDLILKINEQEFRAHRDVLRARSPVFKSMLTHDMVEKNSGVIDVADCDPQAIEQFLYYIYSGKVQSLDQNNVHGLYYISDKYEMKDLKEECSKFIKQSLSPNNFCNVIQLALNHSDSSLQEFATEFFISNVLDILCTVEWQTFMKDNLTVANELIIKSHQKKK